MKKAFLFPGQGSQFIGMGQELASQFEVAKDVFSEVDDGMVGYLRHSDNRHPSNGQAAYMASAGDLECYVSGCGRCDRCGRCGICGGCDRRLHLTFADTSLPFWGVLQQVVPGENLPSTNNRW